MLRSLAIRLRLCPHCTSVCLGEQRWSLYCPTHLLLFLAGGGWPTFGWGSGRPAEQLVRVLPPWWDRGGLGHLYGWEVPRVVVRRVSAVYVVCSVSRLWKGADMRSCFICEGSSWDGAGGMWRGMVGWAPSLGICEGLPSVKFLFYFSIFSTEWMLPSTRDASELACLCNKDTSHALCQACADGRGGPHLVPSAQGSVSVRPADTLTLGLTAPGHRPVSLGQFHSDANTPRVDEFASLLVHSHLISSIT